MVRDSVLRGLKVTNHLCAQTVIVCRSLLRHKAAVSGCSTIIYKLVSSANNLMLAPMSVTMSFMNIKKRSGPRIEPRYKVIESVSEGFLTYSLVMAQLYMSSPRCFVPGRFAPSGRFARKFQLGVGEFLKQFMNIVY